MRWRYYCIPVNIPSQPRSVSVVEVTEFTVSLQWSEPAQNADKVTGYRVKVNQTSSNTSLTVSTGGGQCGGSSEITLNRASFLFFLLYLMY